MTMPDPTASSGDARREAQSPASAADEPAVRTFEDDDRNGYALQILRSHGDGDFHVSVLPTGEKFTRASVRVCSGIGGGKHHDLYMALAGLFGCSAQREAETSATSEASHRVLRAAVAGMTAEDMDALTNELEANYRRHPAQRIALAAALARALARPGQEGGR